MNRVQFWTIIIIAVVTSVPLAPALNFPTQRLIFGNGSTTGYGRPLPPDLASLKAASDIVVGGTVTGVVGPYGNSTVHIIYTLFTFNVVSYVKGTGASTIYVSLPGGTIDGTLGVFDDDVTGNPLFNVGERYVLFLGHNLNPGPCPPPTIPCIRAPTPLDITYWVIGGPEGRYLIINGLVYGYKTLYPFDDQYLHIDVNGEPLDQFLDDVRNA